LFFHRFFSYDGCFWRGTNEFDPVTLSCRKNKQNLAFFDRFLCVYDEKRTSILLKPKEGKTSSFSVELVKITDTFCRFELATVRSAAKEVQDVGRLAIQKQGRR